MLYAILISIAIGIAGGWLVKDWKDGAEVALVNSQKDALKVRNDVLVSENAQCATDIQGVKSAVAILTTAAEERERAAAAAMAQAELKVAQHAAKAKAVKELPPVPPAPEAQCAAIVQEQIDYVESRHE